jgi:hypothetical protein
MRTYFDNAPEEEGTQLLLSDPLTADEEIKVRALGADYQEEQYAGQFESAWVNCGDGDEKVQVVQLLATFGITEETVDKS